MKFIARHEGREFPVEVERLGSGYRVRLGERWIVADLANAGLFVRSLRMEDGTQFVLIDHREGNEHQISLAHRTIRVELTDPLALRRAREDESTDSGSVRALMPGRIVRVFVQTGETVRKGSPLVILEAMKMENEVQSPRDGIIGQIRVKAGETVEGGAEMIHIDEP
jgi:3-methylcrotonyl-CoA carboxylase alpha subunit